MSIQVWFSYIWFWALLLGCISFIYLTSNHESCCLIELHCYHHQLLSFQCVYSSYLILGHTGPFSTNKEADCAHLPFLFDWIHKQQPVDRLESNWNWNWMYFNTELLYLILKVFVLYVMKT